MTNWRNMPPHLRRDKRAVLVAAAIEIRCPHCGSPMTIPLPPREAKRLCDGELRPCAACHGTVEMGWISWTCASGPDEPRSHGVLQYRGDPAERSSAIAPPSNIELWIVGLLMASSIDPGQGALGPEEEDECAMDDFEAWRASWDVLRPEFARRAADLGWLAVGDGWEYHPDAAGGADDSQIERG